MADMKVVAQTTGKKYVANGGQVDVTGFPDGAIYTMDWVLSKAIEGKLFIASVGTITTPITFGAYDALQPELVIDVPNGTTIVPVWVQFHLENSAGTDTEIICVTATNNVGAGTSTAITPLSTRTSRPSSPKCSVYSAYSGNGTSPTNTQEFFRWGDAFADAATKPPRVVEWSCRNQAPVVIDGTGSLVVYISATSTQADGFIKVGYIELLTTKEI